MPLPPGKVRELNKRLAQHKGIDPRLTYAFPLSRSRRMALELIDAEKPDPKKVLKLLKSRDFVERRVGLGIINNTVLNLGPGGVKTLEGMMNDNRVDAGKVANALSYQGPEAIPVLEGLLTHGDGGIKDAAKHSLMIVRGEKKAPKRRGNAMRGDDPYQRLNLSFYELMGSRKPLFATAYTNELINRVQRLDEVSRQLGEQLGDGFLGVSVHGSTAKGYSSPSSDLDYSVIGSDPDAITRFKRYAEDIDLCRHSIDVPVGEAFATAPLFHGIFFGDRKRLREVQRRAIKKTSDVYWEQVRESIASLETRLGLGFSRMGVPEEEQGAIELRSLINRVPPPLKEVKRHLGVTRRRAKRSSPAAR